MRWLNCKKESLVGLECVNPKTDTYIIRLSPNSKNLYKDELDDSDTRILSIKVNNRPTIDVIKNILLDLQKEYDSSYEVNSFIIKDETNWLDKATRVGLRNLLNIEKQEGNTNTTIWFKTMPVELEIDKAIKILSDVELYSKQCYDNTQRHYAEIKQLDTIEACLQYDITAGYPAILNITLTD